MSKTSAVSELIKYLINEYGKSETSEVIRNMIMTNAKIESDAITELINLVHDKDESIKEVARKVLWRVTPSRNTAAMNEAFVGLLQLLLVANVNVRQTVAYIIKNIALRDGNISEVMAQLLKLLISEEVNTDVDKTIMCMMSSIFTNNKTIDEQIMLEVMKKLKNLLQDVDLKHEARWAIRNIEMKELYWV